MGLNGKAPVLTGAFDSPTIIAGWLKLPRNAYVIHYELFRWGWGLTTFFWMAPAMSGLIDGF
jgi:hypothetical protein